MRKHNYLHASLIVPLIVTNKTRAPRDQIISITYSSKNNNTAPTDGSICFFEYYSLKFQM